MSKKIVMNPDILPTLEEWKLICEMVKQQRELTDAEIQEIGKPFLGYVTFDELDFARAILKKARGE
jgi:hypothetical protein